MGCMYIKQQQSYCNCVISYLCQLVSVEEVLHANAKAQAKIIPFLMKLFFRNKSYVHIIYVRNAVPMYIL